MSLRITSLGSGSKGNATLVEAGSTILLIDSGFSCKQLTLRLAKRGVEPNQISAAIVTHEHSDHIKGITSFSNKFDCPVWMTRGTSLHHSTEKLRLLNIFNSHHRFQLGEITIIPVAVPHDAREATQFVIEANSKRVGILTDLGHITPYIESQFLDLDGLLLEFNHDFNLLSQGKYPQSLKLRVGGSLGHLNNQQAADFLTSERTQSLKLLAAMHISEENNSLALVKEKLSEASLNPETQVVLAKQDEGFGWFTL